MHKARVHWYEQWRVTAEEFLAGSSNNYDMIRCFRNQAVTLFEIY
jgi:hypothetical protein